MLDDRQAIIAKRNLNQQLNPELSIAEPGVINKLSSGLGAQKVSVPDADEVREGMRSNKNDSKEKSSSKDYDNLLATVGGWMEAIASLDEQPELTEKKASLSTRSIETEPPLEDPDVKTSGNVASFIAGFEGFRSTPYNDVGKLAIGYGTKASGPNQKITKEQALKAMNKDIKIAKEYVLKAKKKYNYNWSDNQVDALTSFTYNAGPKNLNKLIEDGTRGDEEISYMLLEYNTSDGKELEGLTKRRKAEAELFTQGYKKED